MRLGFGPDWIHPGQTAASVPSSLGRFCPWWGMRRCCCQTHSMRSLGDQWTSRCLRSGQISHLEKKIKLEFTARSREDYIVSIKQQKRLRITLQDYLFSSSTVPCIDWCWTQPERWNVDLNPIPNLPTLRGSSFFTESSSIRIPSQSSSAKVASLYTQSEGPLRR